MTGSTCVEHHCIRIGNRIAITLCGLIFQGGIHTKESNLAKQMSALNIMSLPEIDRPYPLRNAVVILRPSDPVSIIHCICT